MSVWFRGLFALGPRPEAIADAPLLLRPHALSACLLFAARPFTRLVARLERTGRIPGPPLSGLPAPRHPRTGLTDPLDGREVVP